MIRPKHTVNSLNYTNGRITSITIRDGENNEIKEKAILDILLAVAVEDLVPLLNPDILAASPRLGRVFYLRSRMMAGMTIYLKKVVSDIPNYHVNFVDSPYALSMIDVTKAWNKNDRSIIGIVASDITPLANHNKAQAQAVIMEDLKKFLPFLTDDNIERIDFQPHFNHPLFANTAGMWRNRPSASTAIKNLYLAGDYCRSHVDLTCMEGAVSTGLLAAEAIRNKHGKGEKIDVVVPQTKSTFFFLLLKYILTPGALIAYMLTYFTKKDK